MKSPAPGHVAEQALQQLAGSHFTSIREVAVDTCNAELHLRGRVPYFYYKQLAQEMVRDLASKSGLTIVNQIEVTADY
jgi:hypothetical protein